MPPFLYNQNKIPGRREEGEELSMLQYRLSVVRNITVMKTFGKPAMSICGADNFDPATIGAGHDTQAWKGSFGQFLYIPIRS